MTLSKGEIKCSKTNLFSSECQFSCNPGYRIEGASTSICTDSSRWSEPIPSCVAIICNDPYSLQATNEGIRKPDMACSKSYQVGSICNFSCQVGYELLFPEESKPPEESITCLETGTWSSQAPMCAGVHCQSLLPTISANPEAVQAKRQCTNVLNRYPSNCIFYCDEGYDLKPNTNQISCTANGIWQPVSNIPVCEPIKCNEHVQRRGTTIDCSNSNNYLSVCQFSCHEGYQMTGVPEITCEKTGWTNNVPFCDQIDCGQLPVINNGEIVCTDEWDEGKLSCKINCNSGFYLPDEFYTDLTCEAPLGSTEGTWNRDFSKVIPSCQPLICESLKAEEIEHLECKTQDGVLKSAEDCNHFGCTCSKKCRSNEAVRGGLDSITCMLTEDTTVSWSGSLGYCELVVCYPLAKDIAISNTVQPMYTTCTDRNIKGSTCTVNCEENFRLIGQKTLTCRDDGSWSSTTMYCEEINCKSHISGFSRITNGDTKVTNGAKAGSVYSFTCNEGYALIGENKIECLVQEDFTGLWSHDKAPVCEKIMCTDPHIDEQHLMHITCDTNPIIKMYEYGTKCQMSCKNEQKYALIGSNSITCASNDQGSLGFWKSEESIKCKEIKCPKLPQVDNGQIDCNMDVNTDFPTEASCRVTCDDTHEPAEYDELVCLRNQSSNSEIGVWHDNSMIPREKFLCRLRDEKVLFEPCPIPKTLFNQEISLNEAIPNTECNYHARECNIVCPVNFKATSESIFCDRTTKTWKPDVESITCKKKTCGVLPDIPNAAVQCTDSNLVNSYCVFKCNQGYGFDNAKYLAFSFMCSGDRWIPKGHKIPISKLSCQQTHCFSPKAGAFASAQVPDVTCIDHLHRFRKTEEPLQDRYVNCSLTCSPGYNLKIEDSNPIHAKRSSEIPDFNSYTSLLCEKFGKNFRWRADVSSSPSFMEPAFSCESSFSVSGILAPIIVLLLLTIIAAIGFIFRGKFIEILSQHEKNKNLAKAYTQDYKADGKNTTGDESIGLLIPMSTVGSPDKSFDVGLYDRGNRDSGVGPEGSNRGSGLFDSPGTVTRKVNFDDDLFSNPAIGKSRKLFYWLKLL